MGGKLSARARARVWLMRHAPVTASGVCYGQSDVATTLDARAAADAAWSALEPLAIARVVTSPWARTRELALAIAARKGVPLAIDARLSELHFGDWEGRRYSDLEVDDGARFARWMEHWEIESPPGGETLGAMSARVGAWLDEHVAAATSALVITHAGVIRLLRARARGATYAAMLAEPVESLKLEALDFPRTRAPDTQGP